MYISLNVKIESCVDGSELKSESDYFYFNFNFSNKQLTIPSCQKNIK